MSGGVRVAKPPSRPLLVFDGDCHFCTLWIRRWQQMTGDAVDYRPSQDPQVAAQFPEIPRADFDRSVQFIMPDGAVCGGAEAVLRALAHNPYWKWLQDIYLAAPPLAHLAERLYRFVAE